MHELLAEYPVTVRRDVTWGQMDAFAHVNNTVYLRWFEDARIETFARCGFDRTMIDDRVGPILARTSCVYKLPLTFPDVVFVGSRIAELGDDRFTMLYRVVSERHGAVAAEGDGRIVCFDYAAGRKAPLPAAVRAGIEAL